VVVKALWQRIFGVARRLQLHVPYIPAIKWLREYKREDLIGDLNAGIILSVFLIPQVRCQAPIISTALSLLR
jgi:MFS superfamily sulfate permease-like transporter